VTIVVTITRGTGSKHYALLPGYSRERAVAIEVLLAQVERGEGYAMLAGKADYQLAGALGFHVWVYLALKDNHEVYVAIRAGLTTGLRAVDDELFEPV
jgi:hypothetical protein